MVCLGVKHADSALEGAGCPHCERLPLRTLRSGELSSRRETLAAYLSPDAASSLKAPVLPTKPLRVSSALVGKGYTAAGQAGACLHTMAVLQADLLKEQDKGEQISSSDVEELRRTADLALCTT